MFGKLRIFLFSALAVFISIKADAQYYQLGNDPIGQKWSIIKSDNYKLIYPREQDSLARLYLWHLETKRESVYSPLHISPRRIPVIMHGHTTMSNGVVTWAPRRAEFITTPDAYSSEPSDWMSHLVTHEMRHIGQVEHFTKGIYKVFYYPLGEQVTGLGLLLMASKINMEGDAVVAETELSNTGRGRNADFQKLMRTLYINEEFRSFDRLRFGSKKDYSPNIYEFGYNYLGYARMKSGRYDIIGDIFRYPVKYWWHIPILAGPESYVPGLKTGREKLFRESQFALSKMWKADDQSRGVFTNSTNLKRKIERHQYSEYTSPIYIDNQLSKHYGKTLAIKWGMNSAHKFVEIGQKGVEKYLRQFNQVSSRLVYNGKDKIYWTETVTADAASLKDWSVVYSYDVLTGRTKKLTKKTRYFNPAPSEDGKRLSVAEYPFEGSTFLVELDVVSGKVLSRIEAPLKGQIRESVYIGGDLYASVVQPGGIGVYRLRDGAWTEVIKPQSQSIISLRAIDGNLYFTSDLDGVNNIYTYDIASDKLTRITNSRYGADYPYIDPVTNNLYYSQYGLLGYAPVVTALEERDSTVKSFDEPYKFPVAEALAAQIREQGVAPLEGLTPGVDSINTFDTTKFPTRKYNKLAHSFKIHSWFPFHVDVKGIMSFSFEHITHVASLGATVLSQNLLGTTVSSLSYGWVKDTYTDKMFHSGHFKLDTRIVGNLQLEVKFDVNNRDALLTVADPKHIDLFADPTVKVSDRIYERLNTPLIQTSALLSYPLRFNSGGWYRAFTPYVGYTFRNDQYMEAIPEDAEDPNTLYDVNLHYTHALQYGFVYGQVIPTATSQIFPRWGFGLTAMGTNMLATGDLFGPLMFLHGYVYFPGLSHTQGLKLTMTYQEQFVEGKTYYRAYADLPRGYTRRPDGGIFIPMDRYAMVTADYAIPIYPGEFSLGPIFYFQRLQFIPFCDFAREFTPGNTRNYLSWGADLLVDFRVLRFDIPISIGVRYAHTNPMLNVREHNFKFLFSLSL